MTRTVRPTTAPAAWLLAALALAGCVDTGSFTPSAAVPADEPAPPSERAEVPVRPVASDRPAVAVRAPVVAPKPAAAYAAIEPTAAEVPPTAATPPAAGSKAAAEAGSEIRLLVPNRTFRAEGRPRALRVSYDDLDLLKVLNMEPVPPDAVNHFPDWLRQLDGKQIRIRGFMYPAYEERLSAFVLARDTEICCFGRNPKIYDLIGVRMKEGTTTGYTELRPIDVVGTFHIAPVHQDGHWFQLYKITDASVVE